VPDLKSDQEQLRFAQIRGRMLNGLAKHLPDGFMKSSGAKTRAELLVRLREPDHVLAIVETCAFVALTIEEEKSRARRP
jgi:hypothetical protein